MATIKLTPAQASTLYRSIMTNGSHLIKCNHTLENSLIHRKGYAAYSTEFPKYIYVTLAGLAAVVAYYPKQAGNLHQAFVDYAPEN